MTSNLGAEYLAEQKAGEDVEGVREQVMDVVRSRFRPEFLNRLDEILLFHRLSREQMDTIVDIQMKRLRNLLAGRKIEIVLDDAARTWLADAGYDPVYGARPLKRVIQRNVQDPLAELLLTGEIADGEAVTVSAGAEGLIINGHEVGADADMLAARRRDGGDEDRRIVH
jgi:ATP-dependent Clp protease ATP-binding subunit ClpB